MRVLLGAIAPACLMLALSGCETVDANTANDTTPGTTEVLVSVGGQTVATGGVRQPGVQPAVATVAFPGDFTVALTSQDLESGIRHIRLGYRKVICFVTSTGAISGSQAYFTGDLKSQDFTNPTQLPTSPFVGDDLNTRALAMWDQNGQNRVGVGLIISVSGEIKNGAGQTTYTNPVLILSGNTTCGPLP